MNNIILHIPHARLRLPLQFWKNICVPKNIVKDFINVCVDHKTDKLFGKNKYKKITAKYCRVFCDMEKYADDNLEVMSNYGMGVAYTKTHTGETFAKVSKEYKDRVLKKYYYPYHKRLTDCTKNMLETGKHTVLIDCHSYCEDIIMFEEKKKNQPDICIGHNKTHNLKLIKLVQTFFKNKGYSVAINQPYDGTMVPNGIEEGDRFSSVMLEIHKRTYLRSKQSFTRLQNHINELLKVIEFTDLNYSKANNITTTKLVVGISQHKYQNNFLSAQLVCLCHRYH